MPTPYELDLTASQVNGALNAAYDTGDPVTSGSTKLVRSDAVYNAIVAQIRELFGWGFWVDSTYTSGSPLAVSTSSVQITCDGLGGSTELSYLPTNVTTFWDTSTGTITPEAVGDAFDFRLDFKCDSSAGGTEASQVTLILDIGAGGSPIVILQQAIPLPISGVNTISTGFPLFALTTFLANGGKFYLYTDINTVDVYDIDLFIKRDFSAIT